MYMVKRDSGHSFDHQWGGLQIDIDSKGRIREISESGFPRDTIFTDRPGSHIRSYDNWYYLLHSK